MANWLAAVGQGLGEATKNISALMTDENQREAITQNIEASKSQVAIAEAELVEKQRQIARAQKRININGWIDGQPEEVQNHIRNFASAFGYDKTTGDMSMEDMEFMSKNLDMDKKLLDTTIQKITSSYDQEIAKVHKGMEGLDPANPKYIESDKRLKSLEAAREAAAGNYHKYIKDKEESARQERDLKIKEDTYKADYLAPEGKKSLHQQKAEADIEDKRASAAKDRKIASLMEKEKKYQGNTPKPPNDTQVKAFLENNIGDIDNEKVRKKLIEDLTISVNGKGYRQESDKTKWNENQNKFMWEASTRAAQFVTKLDKMQKGFADQHGGSQLPKVTLGKFLDAAKLREVPIKFPNGEEIMGLMPVMGAGSPLNFLMTRKEYESHWPPGKGFPTYEQYVNDAAVEFNTQLAKKYKQYMGQ